MTENSNNNTDTEVLMELFNIDNFSTEKLLALKEEKSRDNNYYKNRSEFEIKFEEIAEELFNNYHIVKGDITYEFLEIEFYLYSENHPDIITYPRNAKAGDWFFHASGVDICFGPQEKKEKVEFLDENGYIISPIPPKAQFGGILIRSLLKKGKNKDEDVCVTGPLNCCYELFDQFSAIENDIDKYPHLEYVEEEERNSSICMAEPTNRHLNFSNDKNKFTDLIKLYDLQFYTEIKKDESKIDDSEKYKEHNEYKRKKYRFYREDFTKDIKNINPNKKTQTYLNEVNIPPKEEITSTPQS